MAIYANANANKCNICDVLLLKDMRAEMYPSSCHLMSSCLILLYFCPQSVYLPQHVFPSSSPSHLRVNVDFDPETSCCLLFLINVRICMHVNERVTEWMQFGGVLLLVALDVNLRASVWFITSLIICCHGIPHRSLSWYSLKSLIKGWTKTKGSDSRGIFLCIDGVCHKSFQWLLRCAVISEQLWFLLITKPSCKLSYI